MALTQEYGLMVRKCSSIGLCKIIWWMHMVGILVDAYGGYISWIISFGTLLMYMVDVHGCHAWWAHFGT
jgi:hypothetical protein